MTGQDLLLLWRYDPDFVLRFVTTLVIIGLAVARGRTRDPHERVSLAVFMAAAFIVQVMLR